MKSAIIKRIAAGAGIIIAIAWIMASMTGLTANDLALKKTASKGHDIKSADTVTAEIEGKKGPDRPGISVAMAKEEPGKGVEKLPAKRPEMEQTLYDKKAPVPEIIKRYTAETPGHGESETETAHEQKAFPAKGMAFVNAVIMPLDYEINQRFWGWRPNDIINFTDNVNQFQLGVLEVTRRTAVILTERISRTGSTDALDKNLENAMNWFMIKADRYWFPSAESKYNDGLNELRAYFEKLGKNTARFYDRTDNLIPLLISYEDLLGSCDKNLAKKYENDGSAVSFFKSDDYFFYAKGVAGTMYNILKGVREDFRATLEARRAAILLDYAIESCHHAAEIDPLIILNSSLDGIFANHRANMAAPISHARYYLGMLIRALST